MTMLRHLDRQHVEPGLVLGAETELIDQAKELGIPTWVVPLAKRQVATLIPWWRSIWKLRRVVDAFKPDVMHANDVPSCQAMSVVGGTLGIARVVHVRWTITAQEASWWARRGVEAVLCISQWMRDEFGDVSGTVFESSDVEVLFDAVDWVGEGEADRGEAHSPLKRGSPGGVPGALGYSGQLIESKGLDLVIEAMGRLKQSDRPRLLVAGEDTQAGGAYKQQLKALAEQHGVLDAIDWLGFIDDVSALHAQVTAMVCPSRVEPLGLVPLEAARLGVPTIANRVGGLAETIIDDQTGMLVEPKVDAWAAALVQLRDAERFAAMGRAMHDRVHDVFSPMKYQARLMDVYRAVSATDETTTGKAEQVPRLSGGG